MSRNGDPCLRRRHAPARRDMFRRTAGRIGATRFRSFLPRTHLLQYPFPLIGYSHTSPCKQGPASGGNNKRVVHCQHQAPRKTCMTRFVPIFLATDLLITGASGIATAAVSVVQRSDGTTGTISQLGDDVGLYSDAHGNTGPVMKPGSLAPFSTSPHGETATGHNTPFGTPAPPNNLTPAPVLPFRLNQPPPPQQPSPPSAAPPGLGSSGGGRFGR